MNDSLKWALPHLGYWWQILDEAFQSQRGKVRIGPSGWIEEVVTMSLRYEPIGPVPEEAEVVPKISFPLLKGGRG
jgi:hypothetical protein